MTGEAMEVDATPEADAKKAVVRPAFSFKEVTFSDGTALSFAEDEIVVFVGPNNAGKSATLKEMEALVSRNGGHTVVKSAKLHKTGNRDDLESYLGNV